MSWLHQQHQRYLSLIDKYLHIQRFIKPEHNGKTIFLPNLFDCDTFGSLYYILATIHFTTQQIFIVTLLNRDVKCAKQNSS